MGFDCVARTHPGSVRQLNEDAILACADHGLWAVADGMGGHDAGEVASAMVVDALAASVKGPEPANPAGRIVAVLDSVNASLRQLASEQFDERTIGSTVVGLQAGGDSYTCFWAGDSRAYQIREGSIAQLSRDHSLVQELVDAGMLDPQEAETHPNANVITRAVGAAEVLHVDTVTGATRRGDLYLLASDGLTKLVSAAEMLAALSGGTLDQAADRLLELTLERGAPDNVSFVIVQVG